MTGCGKPCVYSQYRFVGDMIATSTVSDKFIFSMWSVSEDTEVQTEVLVYPLTSLVAEFGGTLGLFLGVSFMTAWHGLRLAFLSIRKFLTAPWL